MMRIDIKKKAEKFLDKLSAKDKARIVKAIYKLPNGDIKPLQGEDGFRLRVGDWRIVYDIIGDEIIIYDIGNRGDIYK